MNIKNEYIAIYELNNRTPLFARIAFDAMNKKDFEEAILILQKGIELFESYPTAYFLLGQALQKVERDEEANQYFEKGRSLVNDPSTFNFYSNSRKEKKHTELDISKTEIIEGKSDELEELADILQTAKIEVNYDEPNTNTDTTDEEFKPLKGLVSETLASIYFDQSNFKEAKAIYDTLIEIQPEREDYFRIKIAEIESKM